jgi:DnaJ-domain-containing protein 1
VRGIGPTNAAPHGGVRNSTLRRELGRGELVRLLYRLGRQQASGMLTITLSRSAFGYVDGRNARGELFVLRRGAIVTGDSELARRSAIARLQRLVALDHVTLVFEGGVNAYPPGPQQHVALAPWTRSHLEAQLDNSHAERLLRELAGIRLTLRAELAPEPADEADRRMLAAMTQPRRLDQIWPLARTPRFRLLAFLWFLRAVDALDVEGVVAERSNRTRLGADPRRDAAARMLGLGDDADLDAIKRAYRKLARSLHPDLQPDADEGRRRDLEQRFAEVTAAYELLI